LRAWQHVGHDVRPVVEPQALSLVEIGMTFEVVDARERLERQVAAQTEELRVQRAAIARTQRAVRNLNRTDEEGPTEPALRDPQ